MADILKQDMTYLWASSGDVQSPTTDKIQTGWAVETVPRQWWNWFENRQDTNIAYLLQKGLPEWDSTTEYQQNKSFVNRSGVIYRALLTGSNQDPITATTYWSKAFADSTPYLEAIDGLAVTASRFPYINSSGVAALGTVGAFGLTMMSQTTAATARTAMAAQASHINLTGLSGVVSAVNALPYFSSAAGAMAVTTLSAYARTLLDDADAATSRTTLGLGTVATANLTTSAIDNTAGSVLKVGDFGLGGTATNFLTNIDAVDNPSGFYRASSASTTGTFPAVTAGTVIVNTYNAPTGTAAGTSGTYTTQVFISLSGANNLLYNRMFTRTHNSTGGWGTWQEISTVAGVASSLASYGIGTSSSTVVTDANAVTLGGNYTIASTGSNLPIASNGVLVHVPYSGVSAAFQTYTALGSNRFFFRSLSASVWSSWTETLSSNGTTLTAVTLAGNNILTGKVKTSTLDTTTVPTSSGVLVDPAIRLSDNVGNAQNTLALQGYAYSTANFGSTIVGTRSLGSAVGSHTVVPAARNVFTLMGAASDGANYQPLGRIDFYTGATAPTSSSAPGQIRFLTTPTGTVTPSLALTIDSDSSATFAGDVTVAGTLSKVGSGPVGLIVNRNNSASNSFMQFTTTAGSVYAGTGNGSTYVINSSAAASGAWATITATTASFVGNVTAATMTSTGLLSAGSISTTGTIGATGVITTNGGLQAPYGYFNSVGYPSTTQGLTVGWNFTSGGGEGFFNNNQGGGTGGFLFRNTNLAGTTETGRVVFGATGTITSGSNIFSGGHLYAASNCYVGGTSGANFLQADGNVYGAAWGGGYLSNWINSNFVSNSNLLPYIGSQSSTGGVGTYALMAAGGTTYNPSNTLAGTSLKYASGDDGSISTTTGAGTWRCMGYTSGTGTGKQITVWLRIA